MSKYFNGDKLSGYEDSPIIYVYGSNLEECHKGIADLEAKLAESEKEFEKYRKDAIESYNTFTNERFNLKSENIMLKQQLAEKDKEIEELKTDLFVKNLDREYDCILGLQNAENDKISFAVEQLEKVKEKLLEELQNVTDLLDPLEYEDYHEFIGCGRGYKNGIEEIDNQIKELKEGK